MTRARLHSNPGKCAICGCNVQRPCLIEVVCGRGRCSWANDDCTLCTNPICLAVAAREASLLKALNAVLNQWVTAKTCGINGGISEDSWKRLARARARFSIVEPARAKAGAL
jgi:hypothetical protein